MNSENYFYYCNLSERKSQANPLVYMFVGGRCGWPFFIEPVNLPEKIIHFVPARTVLREPARAYIGLAINEELHMRRNRGIGKGPALREGTAKQGISIEGFAASVGDERQGFDIRAEPLNLFDLFRHGQDLHAFVF